MTSAAVGLSAGSVGSWLSAPFDELTVAVVCALVGLLAAARELGLTRIPLPQMRRSSKAIWERYWGQPCAALLWGLDIGLAFSTWVVWAGVWWLLVAASLTGGAGLAVGAMVVFWIGRATPVIIGPWLVPSATSGPWLDRAVEPLRPAFSGIHAVVIVAGSAALLMSEIAR